MLPSRNPAHVLERSNETYGSMAAHSQIADVVEEDNPRCCTGVHRLAEKSTDNCVVPPRLTNDRGAQVVVITTESFEPVCDRAVTSVWKS